MNKSPRASGNFGGDEGSGSSQDGAVSRRILLRGSLGAAPVLLVSAPRTVMAGNGQCTAASSFASINASRPDTLYSCSGRSPNYWADPSIKNLWPSPYSAVGSAPTKFDDVFMGGAYPGKTFLQVLQDTATDAQTEMAKHLVASALNVAQGLVAPNVLSLYVLKDIWSSYRYRSYYEPTAGIRWYPRYSDPAGIGGITPWLQSTMVG